MFQGSFFINPEVRCLDHPRSIVTRVCMDVSCRENPFICDQCTKNSKHKQKHYGHDLQLKPISSTLQQIAAVLKSSKSQIQNMYKSLICSSLTPPNSNKSGNLNSTLTESNTPNLIKYQQEKQQHYQSVRKHIQSIKYQLSEEVRLLLQKFQQALETQLQNMHKELQKYYNNYRQYFETFSHKISPIVQINKQLKYYSQSQSISIKLMNEINAEERNKWFIELKKSTYAAEKVLADYDGEMDKLTKISAKTNEMMDMLPRVRGPDYENQIKRVMTYCAKDILQCVVKFGQQDFTSQKSISMGDVYGHNKSVSSIHRSHSMQQEHSYSSHNKGMYQYAGQRY